MEKFKPEVSGSGSGLEKIMDPDPISVCPERLEPDPVCPDPVNITQTGFETLIIIIIKYACSIFISLYTFI